MGSTKTNSRNSSGESHKRLENKINIGRIKKKSACEIFGGSILGNQRKELKRFFRLKNITNDKYTVSEDLLDQYENLYGKPDQSYLQKFESFPTPGSSRISSIEQSYPEPTPNEKYSKPSSSFAQTPKRPFSTTYFPIYSDSSIPSSSAFLKKPSPPPPPLFKTTKEVFCYTYYNTESHEQINSFEPLDPHTYNESNSWIINKSKVDVPALVRESQVLKLQQTSCWFYHNFKTGDNRRSFEQLKKTDEEYEWCEPIEIKQFVAFPKEFSLDTEFKKIEDTILKTPEENEKVVEKKEPEFATEEEIQEEQMCLEEVEEKGAQDAIKYIKERNRKEDNLIAYICRELSLKSPRNFDKFSTKRKSAKKRLQDWVQYDAYPSLTLEQAEKLVVMLNTGSKVLVNGDKVSVCGNDLVTLKKRGWLNDEVINFYVELIVKRAANEPGKYPKVHMFNTFFYPLLEKKGYSGVAKITKRAKVDIFSLDMVLVPIHLQIHWALAVINFKERRLEYYDSMSKGCNEHILSSLKRYVEEEYKDKKKASSYDMSGWSYYRANNLPQQNNAYDCGVFAMTFAEHISRGASVLFVPPKHMKYFRLKMMWEIVNSKLLPVDQQQQSVNNQHNGVSEPVMMNNWSINVNSSCPKRKFEDISAFIKT